MSLNQTTPLTRAKTARQWKKKNLNLTETNEKIEKMKGGEWGSPRDISLNVCNFFAIASIDTVECTHS